MQCFKSKLKGSVRVSYCATSTLLVQLTCFRLSFHPSSSVHSLLNLGLEVQFRLSNSVDVKISN